MQIFLLGVLALLLVLYLMGRFSRANPTVMARRVRVGAGAAAIVAAAVLFVRGAAAIAVPLAMLGSWLIWGNNLPWRSLPQSGPKLPGQRSRVVTDYLEMELDHDSGAMTGRVLRGVFAGRRIETMKPVDLALLWQDCRHVDPKSAQLVEAFLDSIHPSWRDDLARGEAEMGRGPDGRMTVAEAHEILGLKPGAGEEDIRRAHRELMLKLHPDRGGSNYLAAKINEAKDVLLEDRR